MCFLGLYCSPYRVPKTLKLINLGSFPLTFLLLKTLLSLLLFQLVSHWPALVELFLTSDHGLCSVEAFAPLGNFDCVVVSIYVDFAATSEKDAPYYHKAFDYRRVDWDDFHDHLRDVPWNDIYIYGASKAIGWYRNINS